MAVGPSTVTWRWARWEAEHLRRVIALTLVASLTGGCISIRMEKSIPSPAVNESGFLEVRVFESMSDLRREATTKRQILSELFTVEGHQAGELVHRSSDPVWALSDLSAGKYRLQVGSWVDSTGAEHSFWSSDRLDFDVTAGTGVRLSVVMRSGRGAAKEMAAAAMVVVWVVVCAHLDTHGVPCQL